MDFVKIVLWVVYHVILHINVYNVVLISIILMDYVWIIAQQVLYKIVLMSVLLILVYQEIKIFVVLVYLHISYNKDNV